MKVEIGDYPKEGERSVLVEISDHDAWSLDSTLAFVIAPALRRLQTMKHGYPFTRPEDAPGLVVMDADEHGFSPERWNWILEEMCWAFEQVNTNWESQFHHGTRDIQWVETDKRDEDGDPFMEMIKGPNDTSWFDKDGHRAYAERMQRGFELFGRYYTSLWD